MTSAIELARLSKREYVIALAWRCFDNARSAKTFHLAQVRPPPPRTGGEWLSDVQLCAKSQLCRRDGAVAGSQCDAAYGGCLDLHDIERGAIERCWAQLLDSAEL